MAITAVGSVAFGHNSGTGADASVNVPTGAATDLEVALGGSNFFDVASGFGPPSGGGWTLQFTVDRGVDDAHLRCWTRTAPAGAHAVTLTPIGGEEVWLAIRRLAGASLTNPVDDVDGATSANANHTCPALTLATAAWLFGCAQAQTFEGGGTYTSPSGTGFTFSELEDFQIAGTALTGTVAEDQSAGPGTLGPFTFVYSVAEAGCALVIGVRDATAATDLVVQDASQGQTADGPTLTQIHVLTVQDASQSQTADTPTLTQVHNLTVQDASQGQAADNPTLTQVHLLNVQNASQGQTAENVTVDADLTLVVQDASQSQTADSPTLGPGFVINALLNPSWYGWPDATNTGTTGVLTPTAGGIDVTVNDTVLEDLDIDGISAGYGIFVAAGVTGTIIRNCHIITTPGPGGGAIVVSDAVGGEVLIEDVELEYDAPGTYAAVVSGPQWTMRRANIHHVSEGPRMQDDTTLEDCWIHDMEVDDPDAHADGVQSTGGSNIVIHHNTIVVNSIGADFANAAIIFGSEFDDNLNGQITDNLLDWGGFTLQFGQSNFPMDNLTISGNRFGRNASFGPYATDGLITDLTWSVPDLNVFDDDNTEVVGPALVVQADDASQGQAAENVTLNSGSVLTVQDAEQGQTTESVTLTQGHVLVVQDASQSQAAETVSLVQVHNLTVNDASQGQTAQTVTLQLPGSIPELDGTVSVLGLTGTVVVLSLGGNVTTPQLTGTVDVV